MLSTDQATKVMSFSVYVLGHSIEASRTLGSTSSTRNLGHHPGQVAHRIAIHSVCATQVDGTSWVYNGNVTNAQDPLDVRVRRMEGGSMTNGSKFFNGDMTADEFRRFFCNGR